MGAEIDKCLLAQFQVKFHFWFNLSVTEAATTGAPVISLPQ
jgi:hypothetical protein